MTTVAFVGLGVPGAPMERNLIGAGFTVVGYNRSRGPVDELVAAGGGGAAIELLAEVVVPLGAVATQLIAARVAQGAGALDHSALLKGVEELSGRSAARETGA